MTRRRSGRSAAGPLALVVTIALPCCSPSAPPERSGEAMWRGLPGALSGLLPNDVILCHHEEAEEPAHYQLWIFRRDGGSWLEFPAGRAEKARRGGGKARAANGGSGPERHDLPASMLVRVLGAKVPGLDPGRPEDDTCRYTHWTVDGVEYQAREIVTDKGWFASIEEFRP